MGGRPKHAIVENYKAGLTQRLCFVRQKPLVTKTRPGDRQPCARALAISLGNLERQQLSHSSPLWTVAAMVPMGDTLLFRHIRLLHGGEAREGAVANDQVNTRCSRRRCAARSHRLERAGMAINASLLTGLWNCDQSAGIRNTRLSVAGHSMSMGTANTGPDVASFTTNQPFQMNRCWHGWAAWPRTRLHTFLPSGHKCRRNQATHPRVGAATSWKLRQLCIQELFP